MIYLVEKEDIMLDFEIFYHIIKPEHLTPIFERIEFFLFNEDFAKNIDFFAANVFSILLISTKNAKIANEALKFFLRPQIVQRVLGSFDEICHVKLFLFYFFHKGLVFTE